jgi:23S rRNA pseudouridine2605 synthase
MRINKYLAQATGMSRRAADVAIDAGRVKVNGSLAKPGQNVSDANDVRFDDRLIEGVESAAKSQTVTILIHKPIGYVVSRNGQGNQTVYDLLPAEYHHLKPIGRLDKNTSGLLLLTNDGQLAFELTHPSHQKMKIYRCALNKPLLAADQHSISDRGIELEDGLSRLALRGPLDNKRHQWQISMHEGRNRQIRRTFEQLGYRVSSLQRIQFGDYLLDDLPIGQTKIVSA